MTFLDPSKIKPSIKMTILSLLMTGLLAGCGIRGNLKTPPPVFGGDSKADAERIPTEDLDTDNEDEDGFEYQTQDPLTEL